MEKYVYIQSDFAGKDCAVHDLFTVGFYQPSGKWEPESDHRTREDAQSRVHYLNGGENIELDALAAAKRDGRLILLPVSFGQRLWGYAERNGDPREWRVNAITLTSINEVFEIELEEIVGDRYSEHYVQAFVADIGKELFTTREEAEASLAAMKGEQP